VIRNHAKLNPATPSVDSAIQQPKMNNLTECPVCSSANVAFAYEAGTNRRPAEEARWRVYACRQCGHGFMNPQPSWHELSSYYVEDYDPYLQDHGAETARDKEAVSIALESGTFRHLPVPAGKRVLDVGCGAGWFLRICKQLGAETFGIEPSAFGAKRSRDDGLEVFNGTVQDYLEQYGPQRKFDVITANHVVEHAPNPVQTLEGAKSLLAPGGTLWISVPNAACYFSRALGAEWHSTDLPYHLQQFTPKSVELAGHRAGLKPRRVYTYSLPAATAASLRHLLRRRALFPQRISMRLPVLNNYCAEKVATYLDRKGDGEALIAEFSA
jgi:2-polyprenyl-3-methyl-5-hydroxy-6-metoxy-1,4-benzoquinol methylase